MFLLDRRAGFDEERQLAQPAFGGPRRRRRGALPPPGLPDRRIYALAQEHALLPRHDAEGAVAFARTGGSLRPHQRTGRALSSVGRQKPRAAPLRRGEILQAQTRRQTHAGSRRQLVRRTGDVPCDGGGRIPRLREETGRRLYRKIHPHAARKIPERLFLEPLRPVLHQPIGTL